MDWSTYKIPDLKLLCDNHDLKCKGLTRVALIRILKTVEELTLPDGGVLKYGVLQPVKKGKIPAKIVKGKVAGKKAALKKKLTKDNIVDIENLIDTYPSAKAVAKSNIMANLKTFTLTHNFAGHANLLHRIKNLLTDVGRPSVLPHIPRLQEMINTGISHMPRDDVGMLSMLKFVDDKLDNYDWTIDPEFEKQVAIFSTELRYRSSSLQDDSDLPSITQRLQHVKMQLARYRGASTANIRAAARAELLLLLERYDWSQHTALRDTIESSFRSSDTNIPDSPGSSLSLNQPRVGKAKTKPSVSPPKKKPVKKTTKYIPGVYNEVVLPDLTFSKKGDPLAKGGMQRIAITLEEFRKEIKKPEFITSFTNSVRELMKAKEGVYQKRLAETQKEYNFLKMKVMRLQAGGTDRHAIKELYPGYDTMGAYVIDLENVIETVKKRGETVTELEIADGLEDALEDEDDGIAALMGRIEIKNQIASQLYSFSKGYKTFFGNFNNIAIYGSAGTGKTRLAKTIAFAFSKVGILARGVVKIVTRTEMVGQYIGHTAPRTRGVLLETLEGVLFIDEAYQLTACPEDRAGSKDFGSEAVTEMVNFLDKYIGLNIVIVAGYEGLMTRCFMTFNEGLPRRFPYRYILSPYTIPELTDILLNNLKRKVRDSVTIDQTTADFLYSITNKLYNELPDVFLYQAGDMLNLSDKINNAINSSFTMEWDNKDLNNNIPIILAGFDDFLESKGYAIDAPIE